jgi:transposase
VSHGPDEQLQECSPDAERSRGHGAACDRRRAERGTAAARQFNTTPKTVAKWVERFRAEGVDGLRDRSSRPLSLPGQTAPATCAVVEALRRQRYTGKQIAVETGVSAATLSRILRRLGLNRIRDLEPAEPVRRYERATPGEMIHVDIKKLGRFDKVGHRITGDRTGQSNSRGVGWGPRLHRRSAESSAYGVRRAKAALSSGCNIEVTAGSAPRPVN